MCLFVLLTFYPLVNIPHPPPPPPPPVLTFKNVPEFLQPIFGQLFGPGCNILSAKLLNIFSSLVVYEWSNPPPPVAWCQIAHPHSSFKVKFPTPREREGVKCHGIPWG